VSSLEPFRFLHTGDLHRRYTQIVAPPGDAGVRVETEAGQGRATDELSRGTAEQLYLALRFGLRSSRGTPSRCRW
jgi:uncharacterized protein YhaN